MSHEASASCSASPPGNPVFLYLPLVLVVISAFNESSFMAWPPPGLTLRWFGEALENSAIPQAFMTSILAATGATAIAIVLGTLAAMAVQRYSFFGRETVSLLILPIALPGVVTGIALSSTFQTFGVEFGLMTIVVGHATFCIVVAYNNVIARLRRLPRTSEDASADLGADTWITFRRITMPGMRSALHPARCRRSPCRSTRSSSRSSPPAPARRRSRSGCSPRCSGRRSCRS